MSSQIFPILDPIDESFLYFKARDEAHIDGDWHRGVQAHLVRIRDDNDFEMLIQERSDKVDIGLHKLDQSVATQMIDEDELSEDAALARGLLQELRVHTYTATKISPSIRIIKTYDEHPDALNREIISLYLVKTHDEIHIEGQSKITRAYWVKWSELIDLVNAKPETFTKTAQFYLSCPEMMRHIESESRKFLGLTYTPTEQVPSMVHVNKQGQAPKTYFGDIGFILKQLDEI